MRWVCEWSFQLPVVAVALVQAAIPCCPQAHGIAKLSPCPRHAISCSPCPALYYRSFCVSRAEVRESWIVKTWENPYDLLSVCHWNDRKRSNIHSQIYLFLYYLCSCHIVSFSVYSFVQIYAGLPAKHKLTTKNLETTVSVLLCNYRPHWSNSACI